MTDLAKYQLSNQELLKKSASLVAAALGVAGSKFPIFLMPATYYINSYVLLDLYFARRDMVLHHLFVLSFFAAITLHDYPLEYKREFMLSVIRFEYSTILYGGGPLLLHYLSRLPDSASSPRFIKHSKENVERWISYVNSALHIAFAITFFKYRIYDFAVNVVFRKHTYAPEHFSNAVSFVHLIATTWGFYALNLYWLQLIIWKVFARK